MDDVVFWGDRRLCGVRLLEFDCVRELLTLHILCVDWEGVVVAESGANVKTVLATEIPGYMW